MVVRFNSAVNMVGDGIEKEIKDIKELLKVVLC